MPGTINKYDLMYYGLKLSVGWIVRSSLSYCDMTLIFEGKIVNIETVQDGLDDYYIDIMRNDGVTGDGHNSSWRTRLSLQTMTCYQIVNKCEWDV